MSYNTFEPEQVTFTLGAEIKGKPNICCFNSTNAGEVAITSPPCVTNWPRVNGDGDFGTMWGPTDPMKAKFTLDLTDTPISSGDNLFAKFETILNTIDDRLLDFVQHNQLKLLGRKNLSRDEVKMLQIRSVRMKYDKVSQAALGASVRLSTPKYAWDGMGGKFARVINVCDYHGKVIPNGVVQPGDIVAATMYINQIYTGVGGDKFGIHWAFEDVAVICQRAEAAQKTSVPAFTFDQFDFARDYNTPVNTVNTEQFSEQFVPA